MPENFPVNFPVNFAKFLRTLFLKNISEQLLLKIKLEGEFGISLHFPNLDDSIDSGNFSVRGYLPLIRKDSGTYTHGLAVYVK